LPGSPASRGARLDRLGKAAAPPQTAAAVTREASCVTEPPNHARCATIGLSIKRLSIWLIDETRPRVERRSRRGAHDVGPGWPTIDGFIEPY
jgi:hypothetical protein